MKRTHICQCAMIIFLMCILSACVSGPIHIYSFPIKRANVYSAMPTVEEKIPLNIGMIVSRKLLGTTITNQGNIVYEHPVGRIVPNYCKAFLDTCFESVVIFSEDTQVKDVDLTATIVTDACSMDFKGGASPFSGSQCYASLKLTFIFKDNTGQSILNKTIEKNNKLECSAQQIGSHTEVMHSLFKDIFSDLYKALAELNYLKK
ncbi:MAG: hypothetical protein HQK78_17910 [Desulfobacterales bacterium]|nr:hypothetical protein [Desulfobacterales bacterium]